jgi:hypothetical protein
MLPGNYTDGYVTIPTDAIYPLGGIIANLVFDSLFIGTYICYYVAMGFFFKYVIKGIGTVNPKIKGIIGTTLFIVTTQFIGQISGLISNFLYLAIDKSNYTVPVDLYNAAAATEFIFDIISWIMPVFMVILICYIQFLFWETAVKLHIIPKKYINSIYAIKGTVIGVICIIWTGLVIWGITDTIYIKFMPEYVYMFVIYTFVTMTSIFIFLIIVLIMGIIPSVYLMKGIMKNKADTSKKPLIVTLFLVLGMTLSILIYNIGFPIALIFGSISQASGMAPNLSWVIVNTMLNIFINVAVICFAVCSMCLFYPMMKVKDMV